MTTQDNPIMTFAELMHYDLDRCMAYTAGDNSGTEHAHTMALSIITPMIQRLVARIQYLESELARLQPDEGEGSWGVYQHAKPTPEKDPWPGF